MDALMDVVEKWGLFAGLALTLIYALHRNYERMVENQREDLKELSEKLASVEVFCRTTLLTQLNDNAKVIEANTEAMRHCKKNAEQKADMLLQESRH